MYPVWQMTASGMQSPISRRSWQVGFKVSCGYFMHEFGGGSSKTREMMNSIDEESVIIEKTTDEQD